MIPSQQPRYPQDEQARKPVLARVCGFQQNQANPFLILARLRPCTRVRVYARDNSDNILPVPLFYRTLGRLAAKSSRCSQKETPIAAEKFDHEKTAGALATMKSQKRVFRENKIVPFTAMGNLFFR